MDTRDQHDAKFPWFRKLFLLFAAAIYIGDTGLDLFVAYEHHKHYLEGDDDSRWYFILTLVFIILPSAVMNFASWGLYVWCYVVNNWERCHNNVEKKSIKLKRKFRAALMNFNYSLNYSGVYLPTNVERRQTQQTQREDPFSVLRQDSNLESDLQCYSNESHSSLNSEVTERQPQSKDLNSHYVGNDQVDYTNIKFRPIDNLKFKSLLIITIMHVLQFGLLGRVFRLIYLSSKDDYSYYRYYDLTFLRLIESFMESAPQMILQLYIYIVTAESDPVYRIVVPISMLFSLVSLALAITDYHSAGKDTIHYMFNKNYPRLSWKGYFVIIFWQLCLIISRTLAFTLFATVFDLYLFAFLLCHYLLMLTWIYVRSYKMFKCEPVNNDEPDSGQIGCWKMRCWFWLHPFDFLTRNYCLEIVIAAFNSFFFFNFIKEKSRLTWILYYMLQGIENLILIGLFFVFTDSPLKWNNIISFISTFVSFFLGMAFMGLYYHYFHPAKKSLEAEDQPDSRVTVLENNISSEFYGRINLLCIG